MNPNITWGGWFVFGIIVLILLASTAPRIAGGVAILIAIVLATTAAKNGII
jgi:hypothetical protein